MPHKNKTILVTGDFQDGLKTQFIRAFATTENNGTQTVRLNTLPSSLVVGFRDSTGMEDDTPLNDYIYAGINGMILLFNYNDPNSFTSIQNHWINKAKAKNKNANCPILIVGVQSEQQPKIDKHVVIDFAKNNKCTYVDFSFANHDDLMTQITYFAINDHFNSLQKLSLVPTPAFFSTFHKARTMAFFQKASVIALGWCEKESLGKSEDGNLFNNLPRDVMFTLLVKLGSGTTTNENQLAILCQLILDRMNVHVANKKSGSKQVLPTSTMWKNDQITIYTQATQPVTTKKMEAKKKEKQRCNVV